MFWNIPHRKLLDEVQKEKPKQGNLKVLGKLCILFPFIFLELFDDIHLVVESAVFEDKVVVPLETIVGFQYLLLYVFERNPDFFSGIYLFMYTLSVIFVFLCFCSTQVCECSE